MPRLVSAPSGFVRQLRLGRLALLGLCWGVVGYGAVGCGPSFEAIQEGDLRFAHCDRLDLDPNISASHRLHCWREWRRVYTYGQTRDRVEYSQRRIAEVVSGDTGPPFELPSPMSRRADVIPAGEPNPLHNPPPAVAPMADDTGVAPPGGPAATADGPSCVARCEAARSECTPGCEARQRGCGDCDSSFEACLGDCKSSQK
jgi:hypothetical protein